MKKTSTPIRVVDDLLLGDPAQFDAVALQIGRARLELAESACAGAVLCSVCGGSGWRTYPSTSTWLRHPSGSSMTSDVCDTCWGSGYQDKPWTNLRQVAAERAELARRRERESG